MNGQIVDIMNIVVKDLFLLTQKCDDNNEMLSFSQEDTVIDMAILCYQRLAEGSVNLVASEEDLRQLAASIYESARDKSVKTARRILIAQQLYEEEQDTAWV